MRKLRREALIVRWTASNVLAIAALVAAAHGAIGCGGEDPEPPQHPAETIDKLPKLPPGWKPFVNHRAGFAMAAPPGGGRGDGGP